MIAIELQIMLVGFHNLIRGLGMVGVPLALLEEIALEHSYKLRETIIITRDRKETEESWG